MDPVLCVSERVHNRRFLTPVVMLLCVAASAQANPKAPPGSSSSAAERGISLASKGRCREALPVLKKASAETTNKDLKYDVLMSTARCAIGLEQSETAVRILLELNRTYGKDPIEPTERCVLTISNDGQHSPTRVVPQFVFARALL
jgi:thioredoxin-like negative regulator of GroEL